MNKRVLTIQDISCFGQCSSTVALPIVSACGIECAVLPSAVLSTHTGRFKGYTFRDLTDDLLPIRDHWVKEGIKFDAFYTGYLGSVRQVDIVREIMATTGNEGALRIIDPVLADAGKLYAGFDLNFVEAMKRLCGEADVLLPNISEASYLTGLPYTEEYDRAYIAELCKRLCALGTKCVVMTGIGFRDGYTGIAVYEDGELKHYEHKKVSMWCHGTGDIYASAITGCLMRGKTIMEAVKIAADFTLKAIENTVDVADEHWYGVRFETALPTLVNSLTE
ncbi:MAG: pyridoxamine kinase [Fibrobacter sp.]|nr:pyridoxamine kinase [Fibrobacter sp.]